ncbi:hypothetical protein C7B80_31550 [Cyanosarcina cf. burmensis CCALA 770]|nr:hypothetical protein C7B80_31550 [Cyanosarcina cf. burmensis CCALA 770]
MTSESINWDEDLFSEPEEEYQALVRTLRRKKGFGLFFVRCSPAEGDRLVVRVKADLSQKKVEFLEFDKPIDNLYEIVAKLPNREQINILFIQGLEHSFYEYENLNFGENSDRYNYNWKGVPQILNHLNQQRERFRDDFNNICFVFILRSFSIKYFIRRAPDFFDWRSGIFEFPTDSQTVEQELSRILLEGDYQKYLDLTPEERIQKIITIQELLEEDCQTSDNKVALLFELGKLLSAAKEYEEAIASYDQALKINPNNNDAWHSRGYALSNVGRYEEAIASYDQALKINPNNNNAWYNRGIVLRKLERYEEAIASYDQALKINPNNNNAWNNRGVALNYLGSYEEALDSYDQALKINPDDDDACYNRGVALDAVGRYEEAIASYNQALKISPDDDDACYNRGVALDAVGRYEEAIVSYNQALKISPDYDSARKNRGMALMHLGRYEEAIASFDQALEIDPDDDSAWYIRACCYALQGNLEQAIENLQRAIELNPEKYRQMAKNDPTFDAIREDERFQKLIQGISEEN